MALSLVSYYGKKSKEFTIYLESIQKIIFQQLGGQFQSYSVDQMHGTIIGLETERIGEHTFSKWCLQNNIRKGPVKKGMPKYLQQDPPIHFIKFGGYKSDVNYGFLSRKQHPHARSFSIQGNTMVLNGSPGNNP